MAGLRSTTGVPSIASRASTSIRSPSHEAVARLHNNSLLADRGHAHRAAQIVVYGRP
jgi:hypothetical protein